MLRPHLLIEGLLVSAIILSTARADAPKRLSSKYVDLGQVFRIYLAPGLASVVQLPGSINDVKVGSKEDLTAEPSKTFPNELALSLTRGASRPTNVIVRSGKRTFVFDVIPSTRLHQDLVRISGAYGSPELEAGPQGAEEVIEYGTGARGVTHGKKLLYSSDPAELKTSLERSLQ